MNTGDTIHKMANNILENRAFIVSVAEFVKGNNQKLLSKLKVSATEDRLVEIGSKNQEELFVPVSPHQKSTSVRQLWPNVFLDNEAEESKAHIKVKSEKLRFNSSSDGNR